MNPDIKYNDEQIMQINVVVNTAEIFLETAKVVRETTSLKKITPWGKAHIKKTHIWAAVPSSGPPPPIPHLGHP